MSDPSSETGPVLGRGRLPIHVIEERATQQDAPTWVSIAKTPDPRHGFLDIGYAALKRAVDRVAWFLDDTLVRGSGETFAFVASPSDIRYGILCFATMKTGHVAFFPSPRNSIEAHMSLLEQTGCKKFLHAKSPMAVVDELIEKRNMQSVDFPDLDLLLEDEPVPDYPFEESTETYYHRPCVCLHTSGSTGIPKPIVLKQAWFTMHDVALHELSKLGANPSIFTCRPGSRLFTPFPGFHAAGISFYSSLGVHASATLVLPPPSLPVTAEVADMFHAHANITQSNLTASMLEDICRDPRKLANLSKVEAVKYAGAVVARDVGQAASERTSLVSNYSMTETGPLLISQADHDDWSYVEILPIIGADFRPHSDGVFELVFTRHAANETLNALWTTFPDLHEWPTRDLFIRHPTKPNYWQYHGRSDDIITFSNGEKTNPRSFEQLVETHKDISGALVFGTGRFQAGLLLDLADSCSEDAAAVLESVWPVIERASKESVAHGRVDRDMVLFTAKSKPFLRAAKGSIQRRLTLDLYQDEIERLYQQEQLNGVVNGLKNATNSSSRWEQVIKNFLQANLSAVPGPNTDLFSAGFDSRLALNLARALNKNGASNVSPQIIYSNNTIEKLLIALSLDQALPQDLTMPSREEQLDDLLERFSRDLPLNGRQSVIPSSTCVLLTGSTGSLGAYILDSLTRSASVDRIICANRPRPQDTAEEQAQNQKKRGLSTSLEKVEFVDMDVSKPRLGLQDSSYRDILSAVTHVIHNAWKVDFNLSLHSFEPHIYGARQLIDLCALSRNGASISFLSSVGTILDLRKANRGGEIAEQVFRDWDASGQQGYSESKHVCELLVDEACNRCDIDGRVLRVGQVAGPVRRPEGMWNKHEWFPSLIRTSMDLGRVPDLDSADALDWIPADVLGDIVAEVALSERPADGTKGQASVFNLVNPHPCAWSSISPCLRERVDVELVDLKSWIETLEQEAKDASEARVEELPAIKLLPFFEQLVAAPGGQTGLRTDHTQAVSATLRQLEPVQPAWMKRWLDQWNFTSQKVPQANGVCK